MTLFDEDVLERAMGVVEALEELRDPRSRRLGMAEFHDLLVRAGCSEAEAHEASMRRGWDRMVAGEAV